MSKPLISEDVVDLGLGDGLRPGAPPRDNKIAHTPVMLSRQGSKVSHQGSLSDNESEQTKPEKKSTSRFMEKIMKLKYGKGSSDDNKINTGGSHSETDLNETKKRRSASLGPHSPAGVSVYAEIPLGTSLRQQRKLFEIELNKMLGQPEIQSMTEAKDVTTNGKIPGMQIDKTVIEKKLVQTKQEVEILKQDLELCQQQLESKYRAIKIMQGEAYAVHKEDIMETQKARLLNRQLQDEINKLQFEMECKESNLNNSQDTWTDRFDRVCQENCTLVSALEEKSLELKKTHAEKMAVCRERDELLALVDVQERQRFESLRDSSSTDEAVYNNFTSIELAILGACQCRGHSPEPCGCAQAAAKMKQEMGRLRDQITENQKSLDEAKIVTDTYRMAFEEQLARNRELIKRLAEMTAEPQMSRVEKAKGAMRWLIKQLNEEVYAHEVPSEEELGEGDPRQAFRTDIEELFATIPEDTHRSLVEVKKKEAAEPPGETADKHELDSKTDNEIIELLADMIADKSEALAHQKLTSRLLAKRNKELEQQLTCLTEGEDVYREEHGS